MKATDKLIEELDLKIIMSKELLDTKELLKKYMRHVKGCEGITFIDRLNEKETQFTNEEVESLKKIEKEIEQEQ